MSKKKLVVFYHGSQANTEINNSDYTDFYKVLVNKNDSKTNVEINAVFCPTKEFLFDRLQNLTRRNKTQELYLHFSGHGAENGIPYDNWIIENKELAKLLEHERIKFCFFSSCRSSDLVKIVNEHNIPIIIGTEDYNDIANNWAIKFQVEFYQRLLENNLTFSAAFENALVACSERESIDGAILLRGEGAKEEVSETQINKLQIVFLKEKFKEHFLVAPNFLKEMKAFNDDKPMVLIWFDDPISEDAFFKEYRDNGFPELNNHLIISDEELYLLEDRGEEDPLIFGNTTLLIHVTKEKILPDELRKHLNNEMIWKMDNYAVKIALKNGISKNTLLNSQDLVNKVGDDMVFNFDQNASDLFMNGDFKACFSNHEIPFAIRKKITLDFNVLPVKKELVELRDANKFVRVFLGRNFNENLINFLVNWIRSKDQLTCEAFVFDNQMDSELNFDDSLKTTLQTYFNKPLSFNLQCIELLKEGCILIFKNRHSGSAEFTKFIKSFLDKIDLPMQMFEGDPPKKPSLIFFLQEEKITIEPSGDKIYLKTFSTPIPPNTEVIGRWQNKYSIVDVDSTIADEVKRVAESLNPEQFKDCCPSSIIDCVCDGFNLPRAKITML